MTSTKKSVKQETKKKEGKKLKKVCIITPTYNEKENIVKIIPMLQTVIKTVKNYKIDILVADDQSPDGTGNEVKKLMIKNKNLKLLSGEKQGLGVAYQRAFKQTMDKYDVIIMMDADLSHPPELIPKFLSAMDNGSTFVIGSRYVKGGATPDWGAQRKIISKGGNVFARFVAGLYKVHDCTSGFRAIDAEILRRVDFDALATRGYAFLTTLLYECYTKGAKFKEVPLIFNDRKYGETKLTKKDIIEFFFNAWRIRLKDSERLIKFGVVGGSGILVNIGIFSVAKILIYSNLGQSNATLLASSLIGDELSIIWNFILNHAWTFSKTNNDDHLFKKLLKFHMVAVTSVFINNAILFALVNYMGTWDLLAKFIGILVGFLWNYFANVKWTWREKI